MTTTDTFEFVSKSCRPSVILIDSWELADCADVLINEDVVEIHAFDLQTLIFGNTAPDYLWVKIKEIYESESQ